MRLEYTEINANQWLNSAIDFANFNKCVSYKVIVLQLNNLKWISNSGRKCVVRWLLLTRWKEGSYLEKVWKAYPLPLAEPSEIWKFLRNFSDNTNLSESNIILILSSSICQLCSKEGNERKKVRIPAVAVIDIQKCPCNGKTKQVRNYVGLSENICTWCIN